MVWNKLFVDGKYLGKISSDGSSRVITKYVEGLDGNKVVPTYIGQKLEGNTWVDVCEASIQILAKKILENRACAC